MSAAANAYGTFSCQKTFQVSPEHFYQGTTEVTVFANSAWSHPYQNNIVVPKMEQNPRNDVPLEAPQSPRFMLGNAANFQRVEQNCYERPLLMDAWAQTAIEDFDLIDEHRDRIYYLQKENEALLERVHFLENELRLHSELLNQIHATAALKKANGSIENISSTPPATPVMNNLIRYDVQQYQNLQHISTDEMSTHVNYTVAQITTPQVMNSMQVNGGASVAPSDSVKYTIISKHESQSVEPIEIQLAEEDGALNLNSSADSNRLEICLNEQEVNQTQEIQETPTPNYKDEIFREEPPLPPLPAQSGILVKRRRVNSQNQNGTIKMEHHTSTPNRFHEKSNEQRAMQNLQDLPPNVAAQLTNLDTTRHIQDEKVMISIGPNNTRVPTKFLNNLNFDNPSLATRKLLMAVFDRNTLATHSMTGKPSPAFKNQAKPLKKRLDPKVTEDIVFIVSRRSNVSDKEVRNAITTKCADENKMMKQQLRKKQLKERNKNANKENEQNNAQQPPQTPTQ